MIKKVWAMYFSGTGTTEKVVKTLADGISKELGCESDIFNFTFPKNRTDIKEFSQTDLVVFGTPTYAGRVPNLLIKYIASVVGNGALAVPIVLYGNRNYDDSLMELTKTLESGGFKIVSAGAFIGQHAFSDTLAKGRPDEMDIKTIHELAQKTVEKIKSNRFTPVNVNGCFPLRPYYTPLGTDGNPVNILKVKPLTNDNCDNCGLCASLCPMGSINPENPKEYIGKGICIKCGACVKKCPKQAKYYNDAGFLSHKSMLENTYTRRAEPEIFI